MSDRDHLVPIQRDWLGHSLYFAGTLIALGIFMTPIAAWINSTTATQAEILSRMAREEQDIAQQRSDQRLVTQNLIDVKSGLAGLQAALENLRENIREHTKTKR